MDNYRDKLMVSAAPHAVSPQNTSRVMATVLIALIPTFAVGVYQFGYRVLILTAVCIASSVVFEYLFNKVTKRQQTIADLSAVLTGVLFAMNLPSSLPYWMAIVGCFMAIVVFKLLFGGIGQNLTNPAVTAIVFMFIAFASDMTTWPIARGAKRAADLAPDAVTAATPLGELSHGSAITASNMDLFLGNVGGCLGEVSALAILIGGIFLIWRKIITWHIPVSVLGTIFIVGLIWGATSESGMGALNGALFDMFAGGAMLGAFFCATDYVTSPTSSMGKIIYGIGIGLFTMLIRVFASYPEGMSFAILLMNILTVFIDRFCEKQYIKKYADEKGGKK